MLQALNALGSTEVMFHPTCLFLKLQARAQVAKVKTLSSVVTGKEVESDAITLHKELESKSLLSICISIPLYIASCFFFSLSSLSALHYCFC